MKVIKNFKFILKAGGVSLITVPYGTSKQYKNLQVFDERKISNIIKIFKPQKSFIRYATFINGVWKECSSNECLMNENLTDVNKINTLNKLLKSANSVALIKLVK